MPTWYLACSRDTVSVNTSVATGWSPQCLATGSPSSISHQTLVQILLSTSGTRRDLNDKLSWPRRLASVFTQPSSSSDVFFIPLEKCPIWAAQEETFLNHSLSRVFGGPPVLVNCWGFVGSPESRQNIFHPNLGNGSSGLIQ